MADVPLSEAVARFTTTLKDSSRQSALAQLRRFEEWFGPNRVVGQIRGHDVSQYAESMGPATPDAARKAEHIRSFLQFLKKEGLLETNLTPHFRLKKTMKGAGFGTASDSANAPVELTRDGVDALQAELDSLVAMRPAIREDIRLAMMDKDFRENSPLDAAKDKQGHVEARVRDIEATLKRAVVVDGRGHQGKVRVGTTVMVKNLDKGTMSRFVIVGPTEANAADGKISSVSPVGKALLNHREGEEVEISVPSGTMKFRIEEVVQS